MASNHVKKGDTVLVLTGKDKGKKGKILLVDKTNQRVAVEGVNLVKRHQKPKPPAVQGGIIEKTVPIHVSNVMLIEPKTGKPTRVGFKREDGTVSRVSVKTKEEI
jgi:large subunit ribosomal protein L24